MGIVTCQTCGKRHTDRLEICPFCKNKKQITVSNSSIVIIIILIIPIFYFFTGIKDSPVPVKKKIKQQQEDPEIKKQRDETYYLDQINSTSKDDIDNLAKIYAKLAVLRPENFEYVAKRNDYQWMIKNRDLPFGPKPKYPEAEVNSYLRQIMNDPDSLQIQKCSDPFTSPDGWVIGCEYRGKNPFGGMILKKSLFIINNGRMKHQDL